MNKYKENLKDISTLKYLLVSYRYPWKRLIFIPHPLVIRTGFKFYLDRPCIWFQLSSIISPLQGSKTLKIYSQDSGIITGRSGFISAFITFMFWSYVPWFDEKLYWFMCNILSSPWANNLKSIHKAMPRTIKGRSCFILNFTTFFVAVLICRKKYKFFTFPFNN